MLDELLQHNVDGGFSNREDWFPPKKIGSFKAHHPDEQNPRMALPVRKHFDAFWQINLALGCKFLTELANSSLNPEVFALTGEQDNPGPTEKVAKEVEKLSLPESFIRKYSYETEKQNLDKITTYYNKDKYTLKKVVKGNICLNNFQKRAFLGLIFEEKVIIINVHFPHKDFKEILKKLIKKFSGESEFIDPNYNIILCGDFNHKPDIKYIKLRFIEKF